MLCTLPLQKVTLPPLFTNPLQRRQITVRPLLLILLTCLLLAFSFHEDDLNGLNIVFRVLHGFTDFFHLGVIEAVQMITADYYFLACSGDVSGAFVDLSQHV